MNNTYINEFGSKFWKNHKGQLHREDGPACEYAHGYKSWYIHGQRHRLDGPAIENADGTNVWYNGYKSWYLNDEHHRLDGPAVEWPNGHKEWYINNYDVSSINNFICWLQNE